MRAGYVVGEMGEMQRAGSDGKVLCLRAVCAGESGGSIGGFWCKAGLDSGLACNRLVGVRVLCRDVWELAGWV